MLSLWEGWIDPQAVGTGLRLLLIVLLSALAGRALRVAGGRVERQLAARSAGQEAGDRARTMVRLGRGAAVLLLWLTAGLMALSSLGIEIAPLLAGAGVAGLALSLGAQSLIKDLIGGMLILVENQFSVGDVVEVGGVAGGVERISPRATYLRDLAGNLHLIPNGEMRVVTNRTAEWARAVVDLNVPFECDIGTVVQTLEQAARQAHQDPELRDQMLEAPEAAGWVSHNDWAVQVRLAARSRPGKQWAVAAGLRRHALAVLRDRGIDLAVPAWGQAPTGGQ